MSLHRIKATVIVLLSFATLFVLFYGNPLSALGEEPTGDDILSKIEFNTRSTVSLLGGEGLTTKFPFFIESWLKPLQIDKDKSPDTVKLLENFVNYVTFSQENDTIQKETQQPLMLEYFSDASSLSYKNEMNYTTLLNQPLDTKSKAVDASLNYIKNASGLRINHPIPSPAWGGTDDAKLKYENYYKTISSVQSFNTYLLTALYADIKNGFKLSGAQTELMDRASDMGWMASIGSDDLGVILREILLFNSQTYVLMTKMIETQKQQLAALAMMNSLMIVGNQFTERELILRATGEAK